MWFDEYLEKNELPFGQARYTENKYCFFGCNALFCTIWVTVAKNLGLLLQQAVYMGVENNIIVLCLKNIDHRKWSENLFLHRWGSPKK